MKLSLAYDEKIEIKGLQKISIRNKRLETK